MLADALSRASLNDTSNSNELVEEQVCSISQDLPLSIEKKEEFIMETQVDPEMQLLVKYIQEGWPRSKSSVPGLIRPYYTFHDELSTADSLVFKGERLVVPKKLRAMVMDKIYYSHLGIQKCKLRAREVVYWPNINKEIEDLMENCNACSRYKKANPKEPMLL